MATQWLRRGFLLAACASGLLLGACGSGSIESQLHPTRLVAFGDTFADLGQKGSRFTINDGSVNNWTQFVANGFGLALAPSSAGGTSYAAAHARVQAKPDAAGSSATPSVKEQVDAFLAAGTFARQDLVLVNAGTTDVIAEGAAVIAGTQTREQMLARVGQAGQDLGAQVRRLVQAGAAQVVVVGAYNLGRSPWVKGSANEALLTEASSRFNEQMLVSIVDLGANVLYVDAALYLNLITSTPGAYSLNDSTTVLCTSVDPGPGIGIGTGQVSSGLCTPGTLVAGLDPEKYAFADRVYPTPRVHRLFGEYAYTRIRERW